MFQRHLVQNDAPMLVTTNTANRKPVFANPVFARQAIETLYKVQHTYPFLLFAFVIMPDHCNFLLNIPPPGSISKLMKSYKIGVGYDTGLGAVWQSRFHIVIPDNTAKALEYVHLNPVVAGLSDCAEHYP